MESAPDFEQNQELFAVFNSIGHTIDGVYFKEPDCNACLKDILKFMRTENQHTFATRRQLGNHNFLSTDLVPLVKFHCLSDNQLFDYCIRLLTNLTIPPILLFKEKVPEDKEALKIYFDLEQHVFNYKNDLCTDVTFWSVIAKKMLKILQTDLDQRQEDDKVLLERILILIRNVLHVSSLDEENVIAGENNTHDKLLISMKKACIFDILIYICQTVAEHEFAFHVLEIFCLFYREQTAENLANLSDSLRLSEAEKRKDIEHLNELRARSQPTRTHQDKYNRFKETTYVVKNLKSIGNNDMICHKAVTDISELNLDRNKKEVRKAKNRRHFQDQSIRSLHSSSLELKSYLRDLATSFISTSYNLLMKTVRYHLERSNSQENDETYFIWAAYFFMEFNRCSNANIDFVIETLSKEYLHYLHCQIESYLDHIKTDKKNTKNWSKRLHKGLKAYKELIFTLAHLQSKKVNVESSSTSISEELKRKLFYEEEYRELLRMLIMVFDPIKMSDAYLNDLIESNHIFLKMLEYHCKKSKDKVIVQKKKRKHKSKKNKKNEPEENFKDQQELIWIELAPEISSALQGNIELPKIEDSPDLNLFNVLSEESRDDQKLTVMKKIHFLLFTKRPEEAVAIFREARNFFNDDLENTFGESTIELDEELLSLQNILMDDFLLECNKDKIRKLNKTNDQENDDDNPIELEDEEMSADEEERNYKEQVFNFDEFIKLFANQKILQPYCLAFQKYEVNSAHVNNCIIKMFHRIAFECMMYCMFFQLSFFRTIQNIFNKHYNNQFYSELVKFGKYIVFKFTDVVKNNKNVFIEMLYTKSSKEAYIVEHGHEEIKENLVKGPARKKQKKSKEFEEDEFIKDDESEPEENEYNKSAAQKFDDLFGNKNVLESTRVESELDEDKLIIDDKFEDENDDENKEKFSDLAKQQTSVASMKEDNSEKKRKKTKVIKFYDSEDEKSYDESDKEDESNDKKRRIILDSDISDDEDKSNKKKRRIILDSDESDNEDKSNRKKRKTILDSDESDKEEDKEEESKNKDQNFSSSDEDVIIKSKVKKSRIKHQIIESDEEEKENLEEKENN